MKSLKCGITIAALFFTVAAEAQELVQKVTFSVPANRPLIEVLEEFAGKTGMRLAYSKVDIKELKVKGVKCENTSVNNCLKDITNGLPVIYRLHGDLISIKYESSTISVLGNGRISGKIVDEVGNPITGAEVTVAQRTVVTDNNGDFTIDLPSGTYNLTIKAPKYNTLRVEKLSVSNKETNSVSFALNKASDKITDIKEVVITASRKADTQAGLLAQQKKAAQMSDGISAEQISKTPDSDVGGTLKRVTGITTIDNKYVVVRSMGERWNTAAMDGINLPSTEAYNQNFSFDIIPTAMVESVVVSKSATPDMNASFAGGYVEVRTKDIPNENFTTVTLGTSYNDQSAFKEFLTRKRGKYDYFGYDDGTRDFPKGLEPMNWTDPRFFEQSRQFTNDNFSTYTTRGDMGSNIQLALGRTYALKNNNKWGFAGAFVIRNEQNKLDIDHTGRGNWLDTTGPYVADWETKGVAPIPFYNFKNKGGSYNYNSTVAGMLNFGLQLGKNRISFRNSYTHIFDNTLTRVTGWNEYTTGSAMASNAELAYNYFYNGVIPNNDPAQIKNLDRPYTDNTNYPIFQMLLQNKLEGNHKIGNAEINWFAARTGITSDTKDYTQYLTLYDFIGSEILTYHKIYNTGGNFYRGYIANKETDYNYGASVKWDLDLGNLKNTVKTGYAGTLKNNTNQQQKFFLRVDENRNVPNSEKNYLTMYGALEDWFNGSRYVPGGIGWETKALYKNDKYEGEVNQHAVFVMFDNRWKKLRLVWGLRAEYFKYDLISQQLDPSDTKNVEKAAIEDKPWQWMPSANFTYSPTNKINLRLAYNRSVIRPQFNERTGLPYFDPIANGLIYNTEMTSSVINNYDFKFEWFPGLGEIFSAGLYYKNIDRPIEREGHISSEGNLYLYNGNSKNAKLLGVEAEVRKNLGFIADGTFLEKLFISGNFTYNHTKVVAFKDLYKTGDNDETYEVKRPLYGQTPYAYNLGLTYDGDRLGLSFLYNAKGDQYITVGYAYKGEEIQRPYAVADAQISYKFLRNKNLELKLNARNLFNRVKEYYNNYNSYSIPLGLGSAIGTEREAWGLLPGATDRYDKNIDKIMFRAYSGRMFSLSINYMF